MNTLLKASGWWLAVPAILLAGNAAAGSGDPEDCWGVVVLPAFFYTPETGFGGGGGMILTQRVVGDGDRMTTNSLNCFAIYTAKNQASFTLQPEWRWAAGRWLLRGQIEYMKFPRIVFGVGNDTPAESEEQYTPEGGRLRARILRHVTSRIYAGPVVSWGHVTIVAHEAGGMMAERRARGLERGTDVATGLHAEYDSRDHLFWPMRGGCYQLTALLHRTGLGGDFACEVYLLDLRRYMPLGGRTVLAWQASGRHVSGRHPHAYYPTLGDALRGILAGRHQDRLMGVLQGELRFPLKGRFGGVLFAGFGEVAGAWRGLALGGLEYAAGGGLRFMVDPRNKLNVRLDVGLGRDGSQIYVQFGEAY